MSVWGNRTNSSRAWSLWVNHVASSSLVTHGQRAKLYRAAGLHLATAGIRPGVFFFSSKVSIGEGSMINGGCYIENREPVTIGCNSYLGMQVLIGTSTHRLGEPEQRAGDYAGDHVIIGDGCWLGTRVTVLPGVTIGDGCVIAAGAVVTKSTEPNGLYAGVPARRVRDL